MKERNLKIEWILNYIQKPDEQIDIAEEETHFYKIITDYQDKWLKEVVNKMHNTIITAYFDRNKKGKRL
ncbi:MAG: hypothetical protein ABFC30_00035 [Proteiniphilum sp.]